MTQVAELAFGRILRLATRPSQPGDIAEYERCRSIILHELGGDDAPVAIERAPLPGWNFGSGTSGFVE